MKLKKHTLIILLLFIILFVCIGSVSALENQTDNINENEVIGISESPEILTAGEYTYSDLKSQIGTGGNVKLTKGNYTYVDGDGDTIKITTSGVIDGNGAVIDMAKSDHGAFYVTAAGVTIKNLTIKNANYDGNGGAIWFTGEGNVTNCNFTNNTATDGDGGAIWIYSGTVKNCNFIDNTADDGGAIWFTDEGNVINCNFTNNTATDGDGGAIWIYSGTVKNCNFIDNTADDGGAVFFYYDGTVTNCNFIDNTADDGGAVFFYYDGTVTNCNFTGNNATTGSAIYFYSTSAHYVSHSIFLNNRANAESLEVTKNENNITITFTGNDNLLNAIYSDEYVDFDFDNVTYWGANGITNTNSYTPSRTNKEAGQNITVVGFVNGNVLNTTKVTDWDGKIILDDVTGDYLIVARHDADLYYTEAKRVITNIEYYVNVTEMKTNNRTVNITAKSDIPQDIVEGKLQFILPNDDKIDATYAADGIWWALHTFDNAGDYNITASYDELDDVIINNATISIRYDASVDVNNKTLDLFVGDNFTIVATTTPEGLNVTYVQDDSGVYIVDENGVVTALKNGTGSVLVKTGGDGVYAENSTIVNVTVTKVPTEIKVTNATLDLKVNGEIETGATLTPPDAGNLTYTVSNPSIVKIEDSKIIALKEGNTTITVSFEGNDKYAAAENKSINVTVSLNDASVSVNNGTLDLFVDDTFKLVATTEPKDLTVNFTSSNPSVVTVDNKGNVVAVSEGTATITVSVGGDGIYAENSTEVTITVSKIATEIILTNETVELKAYQSIGDLAALNPADAGNLTYKSSNEDIILVSEDGVIYARVKGTATVTVSFAGDDKYKAAESKNITVTVTLNDASVSVENDTLDLFVDDTYIINATADPRFLTVYYTSSDESVAVVTEYGNVKAVGEGTAVITLTVGNGETYSVNSTNVTVTVSKIATAITVDPDSLDLSVGDETVIVANLTPSDAGNVTFTSSDDSVVTVDAEGNVIAQGKGTAIITVSFAGDNKYAAAENKTIKVTVKKINAPMNVSAEDITVGENATIIVTLPDDAAGNVTATVNGKTYNGQVNNGKADIIIPDLTSGNYTVPVIYSGDDKYNGAKGDANVTVNKADAAISIDAPPITEGDNATVSVTLPGDATGKVTVGNEIVNVKEGTASVALTGLKAGITTVPVTYSGDDKYNPIETSVEVIVNEKPVPAKENLTIQATADEITEGENATVIITGLENATGNISLSVNGKTYTAPINNGEAVITVSGLTENVTAVVNYPGDDKYNSAVITVNITVNRNTVTITAENLTKYYRDPQKFTVKVTDAKGQAAANKTVEITINGVTYKRTTDENGTAGLNINLNSGEYPVSVAVDDVTVNSTITVRSTIDASDVVKMFRNDTQYNAIFTDINGTALANINVSFNINGIIYNRTTDAKGSAKLNINLNAGEYIITAVNPVTDEMKSNTIKVISLIESDDLTKYYRNASQFVVRIHSADGGYVGAGEEVKFNINGVFYTRTTNATGHTKLNINLNPGNYTITTYYKGCVQGNNIEVLPILSADDLVMKYRDGSQFKAKLVDGQGKPYANQNVQFNINGVLYNRITGSDGMAKLNINLMSGEYIITSSYNGSSIANKVTIRS